MVDKIVEKWSRLSINLTPEEKELFLEKAEGKSSRKFLLILINGVNNGDNINNEINNINNDDGFQETVKHITNRVIILENILRKMVPEFIKRRIDIKYNDNEFEEVLKFK